MEQHTCTYLTDYQYQSIPCCPQTISFLADVLYFFCAVLCIVYRPGILLYQEVCGHLLYCTFAHGKNASWNRHVQYILIEKPLKVKLIIVYRLPRVCLVTLPEFEPGTSIPNTHILNHLTTAILADHLT